MLDAQGMLNAQGMMTLRPRQLEPAKTSELSLSLVRLQYETETLGQHPSATVVLLAVQAAKHQQLTEVDLPTSTRVPVTLPFIRAKHAVCIRHTAIGHQMCRRGGQRVGPGRTTIAVLQSTARADGRTVCEAFKKLLEQQHPMGVPVV